MGRINKYRIWDETNNIMVYPNEYGRYEFKIGGRQVRAEPELSKVLNRFYTALTPLQFTGLSDKNGKEVYEGDILAAMSPSAGPMHVVFEEGSFVANNRFGRWGPLYRMTFHPFPDLYSIEVIGNIYENPELLKP